MQDAGHEAFGFLSSSFQPRSGGLLALGKSVAFAWDFLHVHHFRSILFYTTVAFPGRIRRRSSLLCMFLCSFAALSARQPQTCHWLQQSALSIESFLQRWPSTRVTRNCIIARSAITRGVSTRSPPSPPFRNPG